MEKLTRQGKHWDKDRNRKEPIRPLSGVLGNQAMLGSLETKGHPIQRRLTPREGAVDEVLPKDKVLYHGSSAPAHAFTQGIDLSKTNNKQLGNGFYTTGDMETAQGYGNVFLVKALRDLHGQMIPPCREMKSVSSKTGPEMAFFDRADEGNDFLHTSTGKIEGVTIYEQYKLTKDGVKSDAVSIEPVIEAPALPTAPVPDTGAGPDDQGELLSFIPTGKPVRKMPKGLADRLKKGGK